MMSLVFAAALLAGAPADPPTVETPAAATPAATAASTPAKGEKPKRDALVCKREALVGTRLPTRVCMSQEAWDARRQDGKDELKQIQRGQPYNSN
jgi:hypothetical protein